MLYCDLARAEIEHETASGVIDLHSLRHTFVSNVVATGATVKIAQELARHSTPVLTFGVYAHARLADIAATVDHLPDPFTTRPPEAMSATGTEPVARAPHSLTAQGQRRDRLDRFVSPSDGIARSSDHTIPMASVLTKQGSDGDPAVIDGERSAESGIQANELRRSTQHLSAQGQREPQLTRNSAPLSRHGTDFPRPCVPASWRWSSPPAGQTEERSLERLPLRSLQESHRRWQRVSVHRDRGRASVLASRSESREV